MNTPEDNSVDPLMMEAHTTLIKSQMDRQYFPSNLLYITAHYPGLRGEDRDWQIFLLGVENGAQASYELLTPPLITSDTAMASSFKSLEKALEACDDLELPALEHLLAARNVLAKHCAKCWEAFEHNIADWVSAVCGLRMETLLKADLSTSACLILGARFLQYLNEGDFHPFFLFLTIRDEKQTPTLQQIRNLLTQGTSPPPALLRDVISRVSLGPAVREYLEWAKGEYKSAIAEIREHSKNDPIPTPALATWVAKKLNMTSDKGNG